MSAAPETPRPNSHEIELTVPVDEGGNEMFYVKDGKKQDASLHDEILDGIDPITADKHARANGRHLGLSEEQMLILFGPALS